MTALPLVLASGSPRRKELLEEAGLEFTVLTQPIDESRLDQERPHEMALRLARAKARAVAQGLADPTVVLGADTIVVLGDEVLGKPDDEAEATDMLRRLSGREHEVITCVAVTRAPGAEDWAVRTVRTRVVFRELTPRVIERYIATGEPMDKAGSYGIQGLGVQLVERTDGSFTNVVGLPLVEALECIARLGGPEI